MNKEPTLTSFLSKVFSSLRKTFGNVGEGKGTRHPDLKKRNTARPVGCTGQGRVGVDNRTPGPGVCHPPLPQLRPVQRLTSNTRHRHCEKRFINKQ